MKIQSTTNQVTPSRKKQATSHHKTSFGSLLSAQHVDAVETLEHHTATFSHTHDETHTPSLDDTLRDLEAIMQNLEDNSKGHAQAQRVINSLRDALHEIPSAFPISQADREEAETLLLVESKRLETLMKYE